MKNKDYRQTAGGFKYDDYEVTFKTTAGKEYECGGVEIDFDARKIVVKQKNKEG